MMDLKRCQLCSSSEATGPYLDRLAELVGVTRDGARALGSSDLILRARAVLAQTRARP